MLDAAKTDGTVGKALEILDQVSMADRPLRLSDVLATSPYPKATLYRLLQTLTSQGMLDYDPQSQTYRPGLRLVRLAHAAWRQSSLAPIARPHIDALSAEIGETVHLAQLDNGQVLYIDKRNAKSPIEMYSQAGKIGPAYCTGVGKAMLAHLDSAALETVLQKQAFHAYTPHTLTSPEALRAELDEIRAAGVSFDREEHEPNIICIAAPILTPAGRVIGGISVTSSTQRHNLAELESIKPALLQAATQIGQDAADWHFPEQGRD